MAERDTPEIWRDGVDAMPGLRSDKTMRMLKLLVTIMAALLAAPTHAADGDCGTIVVPPGIGVGPGADVTSFNPLFVDSLYNLQASVLMFEQLVWVNRYHQVDWSRSIASAVTSPDGGKTYDITLRPWAWSDGQPVTSADVLYTFKLIAAYGPSYAYYGLGGIPNLIASVTAPDASHVVITLKHAVNEDWFVLNGLEQIAPVPEHIWSHDTLDEIWQGQSSPAFFRVTDGPLLLTKLNVGLDAEFVPNPFYGGDKMHFEHFIIAFQNSEAEELEAMEDGELDMANIPFDLYAQASHLRGTHVVAMTPSYAWEQLLPNMQNKATAYFADVRVRQAMADAIDQNEMVAVAMHGHGVPTYGPVPPTPATFLSASAKAGEYPVGYDPAKARALLAAAGFKPGPGGVLQKDGKPFSFTTEIPAGQPLRIEMAEVIQRNFAAVGIEMKVRQVQFAQMLSQMVNLPQAWEAGILGTDLSPYPSGEEDFVASGFEDFNKYSNPEMDRLVAESTDDQGLAGLDAYQDFAAAQQPVIFLANPVYSVLVRKGLHGVEDFTNTFGYWAPEKLYCTAP
jgi:peptide/nickel transport system substrate-binding protein